MAQRCHAPALPTPKKIVTMSWLAAGSSEDGASREIKERGETIIFPANVVKGEA